MSKKRVSYQNLLKTAISEFDTSKTVDVKGPMLDPILKWDGQGELPIYKDAASILERYYFDEGADKGVEVQIDESEYNEDGTEGSTAAEKNAEGTGTEQAGTSDKGSIPAEKKEIEKDLAKESAIGKDAVKAKKYVDEQDEKEEEEEDEADEAEEDVSENLENAVIEKLIAEMEEDLDEADMNYTGDGVKPGMEAPKEKKASGPEDDAEGAGTEQAGTGTDAGQVPDRKDRADQMVKPKNYNEQDEVGDEGEDKEGEEAEINVDTEVKEAAAPSAVPGGPGPKKEDSDSDVYEETFNIFKEAIEAEDEEEEDEEKDED